MSESNILRTPYTSDSYNHMDFYSFSPGEWDDVINGYHISQEEGEKLYSLLMGGTPCYTSISVPDENEGTVNIHGNIISWIKHKVDDVDTYEFFGMFTSDEYRFTTTPPVE